MICHSIQEAEASLSYVVSSRMDRTTVRPSLEKVCGLVGWLSKWRVLCRANLLSSVSSWNSKAEGENWLSQAVLSPQ